MIIVVDVEYFKNNGNFEVMLVGLLLHAEKEIEKPLLDLISQFVEQNVDRVYDVDEEKVIIYDYGVITPQEKFAELMDFIKKNIKVGVTILAHNVFEDDKYINITEIVKCGSYIELKKRDKFFITSKYRGKQIRLVDTNSFFHSPLDKDIDVIEAKKSDKIDEYLITDLKNTLKMYEKYKDMVIGDIEFAEKYLLW